MGTKERILEEALRLFSVKGFHAVSVRDIAGAVGIKESSLYNHFQNKQDIFEKILDAQWTRAREYFESRALPFEKGDDISPFAEKNFEKLSENVLAVFSYFLEDEENIRFRRLLVLSQYQNERAREIYRKLYRDYMLEFQSYLFSRLMEIGVFRKGDAGWMAMEFYSPVFLLMHTEEDPVCAKEQIREHLRRFTAVYTCE